MKGKFGRILITLFAGLIFTYFYLAFTKIVVANRYESGGYSVPMGGLRIFLANRYLILKNDLYTDNGVKTKPKKLALLFTDKKRTKCPYYGMDGKLAMGMTIIDVEGKSSAVYVWVGSQISDTSEIAKYIAGCLKQAQYAPLNSEAGPIELSDIDKWLMTINAVRSTQ